MKNIFLKSISYGIPLGTVLFITAPLGLGIYLVEILRPVLAPGAIIAQFIFKNSEQWALFIGALLFNWIIFSVLFLAFFSIKRSPNT